MYPFVSFTVSVKEASRRYFYSFFSVGHNFWKAEPLLKSVKTQSELPLIVHHSTNTNILSIVLKFDAFKKPDLNICAPECVAVTKTQFNQMDFFPT